MAPTWPADVDPCLVNYTWYEIDPDSNDVGRDPNASVPPDAKMTFVLNSAYNDILYTGDEGSTTFTIKGLVCTFNANGQMVDAQLAVGVNLLPTSGQDDILNPQSDESSDLTYTVTRTATGFQQKVWQFVAPAGETVDLTTLTPSTTGSGSGTFIVQGPPGEDGLGVVNGGSTGQPLRKDSGADGAYSFGTIGVAMVTGAAPLASPTFTGLVTTPLIKITAGSPGAGKVLTSDADGDASWSAAASGLPTGGTTAQALIKDSGTDGDATWHDTYSPAGTDVTVTDGGTGRSTSTTAFGIIAAGITATAAHQTISPGTSGQFLKSAGAAALPAMASLVAADISNLGSNVGTFLVTPSSANLRAALTDETGTGAAVFATSPALTTPDLGTPSAATLTNATGLPVSGIVASTATALGVGSLELGHASDTTLTRSAAGQLAVEGVDVITTSNTKTLTNKTLTSPVLTTPDLGTPSAATLTNATGLPVAGITASTATALGVGSLELGHASDTTLSRSAAGQLAVEGVDVITTSNTKTLTNKTLTAPIIATISNTGTLTLPTSTDTLVGRATTDTLTNKRITLKVTTPTVSAGTFTIDSDASDMAIILPAGIVTIANPTGTPTAGQPLVIRIKDDGTARALSWGSEFRSIGSTLPSSTVISKTIYVHCRRNVTDSKWDAAWAMEV